ncbi:MAG: type II toxin-antitoxin system HipA family toxin [Bacteroidales bacterium]|nr:type II toxin-antitoxin system HipA family toxin [Bacteroidales bacterium]MCF8392091.1 type II toxin-antitoxin system HipA family toxin [Bacteroidales bacterium]
MLTTKTDILVYAHWLGMKETRLIGVLSAEQAKGRKSFSFEYSDDWIHSTEQILLDPDIGWFKGHQYPNGKENFGVFFDSMPDTWGRTLMKRRSSQKAKEEGKPALNLYDIDFLLGVYDECRMGALRFKLDANGPFLDNSQDSPTPPYSNIRELQHAAQVLESDEESKDLKKWLSILIAPGSSLGGARPKANLADKQGNLWIAKFPSKGDVNDKATWEFLAYKLALLAGIDMSESRIERISGKYHTFFTKRFDRLKKERIHFASAMTMTGNNEVTLKEKSASYLDIAEFIQYSGSQNKKDLKQLWKRIIFNIAISNTDDHLRNHGFILGKNGWMLSPAFDINPSVDKNGLALNIDMDDNALDFELAKSVGPFFQLTKLEMETTITDVKKVVRNWRMIARDIGISKSDQEIMASAFRY